MKILTRIFFLSILTSLGCNQESTDSYSQYLSQIPVFDLPYILNCEDDLVGPEVAINDSIMDKHKPEGATIFGRFDSGQDYSVILYLYAGDIMWPVLTTATKSNSKISEVSLLNGSCWQFIDDDPLGYCNCNILIDKDFNIKVVKKFDDESIVARFNIDENGIINEIY
jgi:hypothetical protein